MDKQVQESMQTYVRVITERHNTYKGALEAIMDELNWHPSELTKAEKKIREIASKALGKL